jgi:uncharacterized protein YecE (DUF72 family)
VTELGSKLGPVLWQFAPTKIFDKDDFAAFLTLLPQEARGLPLRHVVEVRHHSFCVPEFIALLREHNVAIVFADHGSYPAIADVTADFVYARLQTGKDSVKTCYPAKALDQWADRLVTWAEGGTPDDLPTFAKTAKKQRRDVFAFLIHEGKVNAPAGAMALIKRLPESAPRPEGVA